MARFLTGRSGPLNNRGPLLLIGLLGLTVAYFSVATGPISSARADHNAYGDFCERIVNPLPPQGTCSLPVERATHLEVAAVFTYARAGCIRFIGYHGEPVSGWGCAGSNSFKNIYHPYSTAFYRAEIKNSNQSYSGQFSASFNTW
jgi:hypothetical protein